MRFDFNIYQMSPREMYLACNMKNIAILPKEPKKQSRTKAEHHPPRPHLSREVHHDKQQGLEEGELVLQHPDERQPLHEELDGDHAAQLGEPRLLIAACTQALHDVTEQGQLAGLQGGAGGGGEGVQ